MLCLVMWDLIEKPSRQAINNQSVLIKKMVLKKKKMVDITACPPSSTSVHSHETEVNVAL